MDDDPYELESYWKAVRPARKGGRGRVSRLTGSRFGRLVVLERHGTDKHGGSTWLCQCECGKYKVVARRDLKQGRVKSCGCLLEEYRQQPKQHLRQGDISPAEQEAEENPPSSDEYAPFRVDPMG